MSRTHGVCRLLLNLADQRRRGHKSLTEPYTAGHNLLLAHANATKLYRENYKAASGGQIGITLNGDFAIPYSDSEEGE